MQTPTTPSGDAQPVLTWIGGRWPLPEGAAERFGATFHELVPGGALVCSCGAAHDTPPPSDVVAGSVARGRATLWLPRVDAAMRSRPVHGIDDASSEDALALHLASIAGGGLFGESFEETIEVLAPASRLDFAAFPADAPLEPARAWLESRRSAWAVRVLFTGGLRLRVPLDFARDALTPLPGSVIVQLASSPDARGHVSILAAFEGSSPVARH